VRRGSILQLVGLGVLFGGAATLVAVLIPWLPPVASKQRDRIDFVFWFTTGISIAVFALVAAVIAYSLVKFRVRPDDDSDGPPIHGHTGVEIVWTAVPAVLVTAISIVSAIALVKNDDAGKDPLNVNVTARQFAWTFSYPGQGDLTSAQLRLPLGRTVKLHLRALDVIHSFWVPEFGQKQDAVPGQDTSLVITPTKAGTYPVICTELCGLGHALMRTSSIVMKPAAFQVWVHEQQNAAKAPPGQAGQAVFASNGCASCHTLKAANATGTAGPDLDKLPAYANQAGKPLEAFVKESIVDPNAYVQPGFPKNLMPSFSTLPADQLDRLTALVRDAVGFDATRGDTVNVVNSSFLGTPAVDEGEIESIPFWERAWAQTLAKVLAGLAVLLVIVFSVLKPLTKGLLTAARPSVLRQAALAVTGGGAPVEAPALAYEQQVAAARGMVAQDPKRGAQVVKAWVASDA